MPGEDYQSWSTTAATNATADTSINWAEGQPRASVNNSARSEMAAHAKNRNLLNGSITTGGTANAQTFTSGVSYTTVPTGLTVRLKIGVTNTGATTLNMDGIGAVAIKDQAGADIAANALVLGRYADFLYNGTNWILLTSSGASASPFDALAYNGMQINGSMEVSQERGYSSSVTVSSAYACDGWLLSRGGAPAVSLAVYPVTTQGFPGFSYMLGLGVTTAVPSLAITDWTGLLQNVEGYRVARLAWGTANAQPITIGFWTAHHRTGLYTGVVRNGAGNRSYAFSYTQNAADTGQYNTVTIPGDTTGTWLKDNGIGMTIIFAMAAGGNVTAPSLNAWVAGSYIAGPGQVNAVAATTDAFYMTGVVVLPGSDVPSAARSPLIMRPFTEEIEICKRYYQASHDYGQAVNVGSPVEFDWVSPATSSIGGGSIVLPVEMRATPTLVLYDTNGALGKISNIDAGGSVTPGAGYNQGLCSTKQLRVRTYGVAGVCGIVFHYTLDARL